MNNHIVYLQKIDYANLNKKEKLILKDKVEFLEINYWSGTDLPKILTLYNLVQKFKMIFKLD